MSNKRLICRPFWSNVAAKGGFVLQPRTDFAATQLVLLGISVSRKDAHASREDAQFAKVREGYASAQRRADGYRLAVS
jgi:hypothetical protein